jgi:hypothetical protein
MVLLVLVLAVLAGALTLAAMMNPPRISIGIPVLLVSLAVVILALLASGRV